MSFKVGSCVREVESGRAMNEIEVERLRELALEQQEIIEILRQAVKVMEFSSGGTDASWKIGKTRRALRRRGASKYCSPVRVCSSMKNQGACVARRSVNNVEFATERTPTERFPSGIDSRLFLIK